MCFKKHFQLKEGESFKWKHWWLWDSNQWPLCQLRHNQSQSYYRVITKILEVAQKFKKGASFEKKKNSTSVFRAIRQILSLAKLCVDLGAWPVEFLLNILGEIVCWANIISRAEWTIYFLYQVSWNKGPFDESIYKLYCSIKSLVKLV